MITKNQIAAYALSLFLCFLSFRAFPQETPRVINFTKDQYQAYNQNWSITQSSDLSVFIGNSAGLLEFDGSTWHTYTLPNRQVVRSVARDRKGRIFTGAFSEIGFWERDSVGRLAYQSLTELVNNDIFQREEIWHILPLAESVLFQSFSKIYVYDYQSIHQVQPPGNIMYAHRVGERLVLPVIGQGLFELRGNNGFEFLPGTESLASKTVVFILPNGNNNFLVGTSNDGIFEYQNGRLYPWNINLQSQLIKNQLNKGIRLSNGNIALGTILNGVFIVNPKGEVQYQINQKNGLQNNTVLALFEDNARNLWIGLDKGIDLIEMSSPLVFFNDKSGAVGSVYAAAVHNDRLYIGSNQGVFVKPWKNKNIQNTDFQLINGTQGQVWELKVLDGQLLLGHNNGTFILENGKVQQISKVTGGWITIPHPQKQDVLLQGTYTGLVILNKNAQGRWQFSHRVNGFSEAIKKMVFDQNGNLWVVNPHRGLHRIQLDNGLQKVISLTRFTTQDGLPSEFKIDVDIIDKQLLIKSDSNFLTFDESSHQLALLDTIADKILPKDHSTLKTGLNEDWFQIASQQLIYHTGQKQISFNLPLAPDYESIIPIDSVYLFGLDDGYAIFAPKRLINNTKGKGILAPVKIKTIVSFHRKKRNYHAITGKPLSLSANENSIRFTFSQAFFTHTPEYSFLLEGFEEEWSEWQELPEKEFNRLPPGDYVLKIRSKLSPQITTFRFSIQPHWYQSWWATLLYLMLFLTAAWVMERWNQHRLEKQRFRLEHEKEKQLEDHRIKAANERLQVDVINKSKELANSTMSLIQKNEILLKIKDEIQAIKASADGHFQSKHYQRLLHLIDVNISSEQDWQVFETNFNQVHEQFFKKLKASFPDLTPSDLKLAAYLKMNLSSKEIAPLLNISIRSVENKRYRLRKKLYLHEEDNLTEFMLQY
ncbi:MAG: hypothetical protein SFU99_24465 [Saprospiraceae bacterium]|nr:hypothetical protein [Saprospiraceae bacterium]